jgi:hypothetical protein
MPLPAHLADILGLARWAPSGDNSQCWRFEVAARDRVVVHGFDTSDHCVYDLDGHASQISLGALIETMAIAASGHGLRLAVQRRTEAPPDRPTFDCRFAADPELAVDPLRAVIEQRSVQRRPMSRRPLSVLEKQALEQSLGDAHEVVWLEGRSRREAAWLMFHSAKLRLTIPEAYAVHREIIEWGARFSTDRVPDQALGAGAPSVAMMKFAMKSWPRVRFFNRFLAGTWLPRLELDLLPGLACGAHFCILARRPAESTDDYVAAGRSMQRFWLTATALGLVLQPEVTPLIFARFARQGVSFSAEPGAADRAGAVKRRLDALVGPPSAERAVFMGRVGAGERARARSTRRPLEDLLVSGPPEIARRSA